MAANQDTEPADPLFRGEWSNQRCIEIAFSKAFPSCVKDVNIQKNIISRYFNFYLGGKPQKGLSAADLAFAVISIMPQHKDTEEFIWEDKYYKEDGTMFFLTPEDKLRAEVGKIKVDNVDLNKDTKTQQPKLKKENMRTEFLEYFKQEIYSDIDDIKFDQVLGWNDLKLDPDDSDEYSENNEEETVPPFLARDCMRSQKDIKPPTVNKPSTSTYKSDAKNTSPIKFPENVNWYSRAPKNKEMEQNKPHYGPVENSAFIASCNKLLEEWETSEKARIVLKYFFGIVALILLRAATKKFTHLMNTFASYKFLTTISFTIGHLKYSVPHKKCVKNSFRTFSKKDGNTPVMFAKIVVNSFHIDALRREKRLQKKLNILKLTILSHTADYGFGLLTMLQNIKSKVVAFDINEITETTYCDRTAESWNRLLTFCKTYMSSNSKEATHHWARIISPEFFKDLSCNTNFELSVIFGVFIEKLTKSSDIWQSAWVKSGDDENLLALIRTGQLMFKEFEKKITHTRV